MSLSELTSGEMLFFGGIIGMIAVLVSAAVVIVVLGRGKKRIRRKFEAEINSVKR